MSKRVDLHVKVKKTEVGKRDSHSENNAEQIKRERVYIAPAAVEKDKITLMWGGAIFFLALIFVCWMTIFKDSWRGLTLGSELNLDPINKIVDEFSDGFSSTSDQIEIVNTMVKKIEQESASTTAILEQDENNPPFDDNELNKIKEEIINLKSDFENQQ